MANLYRIRTLWNGVVTGTAVSTFYTTAVPDPVGIKAFWTAIKAQVPIGVTWTIKGSGDVIDETNGNLVNAWSSGNDLTESSSLASNVFAAPAGAIVRLLTQSIVHNRRVQGRVFLVPLGIAALDNLGTLSSATMTTLTTAGNTLISGQTGHLAVWARPFAGKPAVGGRPAIPSRLGSTALVTGVGVPDYCAILRSRRD